MSAKRHGVRCAGVATIGTRRVNRPPCGWTGRRTAYDIGGTPVVDLELPCPHCDGSVGLAPPRRTRP